MDFEQIVAQSTGGDSGSEFARKINDNFSKVNSKIITIDSEIEDLQQNGGGGGGGDDPSPPSGGDSVLITTVPELDIVETTLLNGNIKIEIYTKESFDMAWRNAESDGTNCSVVVDFCSIKNYNRTLPNSIYYLSSLGSPSRVNTVENGNLENFCLIYFTLSGNSLDPSLEAPVLRANGALYLTSFGRSGESYTVPAGSKIYEYIVVQK